MRNHVPYLFSSGGARVKVDPNRRVTALKWPATGRTLDQEIDNAQCFFQIDQRAHPGGAP